MDYLDLWAAKAAASFLKSHQQNKQWSAGVAEALPEMTALLEWILMELASFKVQGKMGYMLLSKRTN